MENKTLLLITNESSTVINFRKEFINYFLKKNNKIIVISGDNEREEEIKKLGVTFICSPFSNRSKNPFSFLKLKKKFVNLIKTFKPDIVFTFQIKPNIIGNLASKKAKIGNVYSMVEGLGDPFQPKTFIDKIVLKIIIFLYKIAFKKTNLIFFLNEDDRTTFLKNKIVKKEQAAIINGIGIDTHKYLPIKELTSENNVLMLSRLLVNKGIKEYCSIAHEVRKKRPDIKFYLYGKESQLKAEDLKPYIENKDIYYGGNIINVEKAYKNARIYLSTSYREGFPRTLLEAMAYGIPIIASDVPGNNAAIINNNNGYLIEKNNIQEFAKIIIDKIDDVNELNRIRINGRNMCEQLYDSNIINKKIENLLDENIK